LQLDTAAQLHPFPHPFPLPVTDKIPYPELGVTVNCVVEPLLTVCGVEGLMLPFAPADGVTTGSANDAVTVQLAVIAPVVYVVPDKVPVGHVPPIDATYPELGVTVNVVVEPLLTVCGVEGLMLPFAPADGVTTGLANDAVTVQFAVIAPVVYVLPDKVPVLHPFPLPVTVATYPVLGVTVNVVVEPLLTDRDEGLMVPFEPESCEVTV
jgi:hypothetical protein